MADGVCRDEGGDGVFMRVDKEGGFIKPAGDVVKAFIVSNICKNYIFIFSLFLALIIFP